MKTVKYGLKKKIDHERETVQIPERYAELKRFY